MSFAKEKDVAEMRDMLLQFGANENEKEKQQWDLRQRADVAEKIMKDNYKNICIYTKE